MPPALVSFFVLAWTLLPGSFWWWTGFPLLVLALPLLLQLFGGLLTLIRGGSWKAPAQQLREDIPATAGQVLLSLVFLADQARLLLDAIGRTLFRLVVSRRRLLDWETAATTERRLGDSLAHFCLTMWPSPIIAAVVGAVVGWVHTDALAAAAPILGAWLLSPVVAFLVSRVRPASQPAPLTSDERHELRRIARRTWFFFERFVGEEDHWLPPDNFQEDPKGQIAHRTSPTNIGMMLLSTLAAHDFGYLTLRKLAERLEQSFATLERLERYQGHFHNWYDTRSLRSLQPGYISTVDSGNLLACFLTLKNGLQEKADEPLAGPSVPCGLIDALGLIEESLGAVTPPASPAELPEVYKSLEDNVGVLGGLLGDWPEDLLMIDERLEVLKQRAGELAAHVNELAHAVEAIPDELVDWAGRFLEQVEDWRNELLEVAPWIKLLREAEAANALSVASQPAGHSTSPLLGRWQQLRQALITPGSVADVPSQLDAWLAELKILQADAEATELPLLPSQLQDLGAALQSSGAADLLRRCQRVADRAGALGSEMNFRFLYHPERRLFAVGYNLSLQRADNAYYDLLASEACVASYLAIARGDAPRRHWFQLGRPLTRAAGRLCLLSWGGTMFEYLMPRLLLRTYPGTLLSESARAAVARHIEYGRECGVPWGISESAYGALDLAMDYHYQAFGVPGLGLKRGLGQSLVIAPYATALAVMVSPRAALENFRRLAAEGGRGRYGFYEALDYTRGRVPKGQRNLVVRTFMAHHQGMSVVALANGLLEDPMLRRFHAEPLVRSAELLLQERVPRGAPLVQPSSADEPEWTFVRTGAHPMMSRRLTTPQTLAPRTHLLSNGRYSVMVTNAGSGYSTCQGSDVTRWREDRTRDCWGQFCYIRDLRSGRVWSAGHQPLCRPADDYEVIYAADKTEFRRRDAGIETVLEITVSPENCAEVRRITLTNHNQRAHELEVTSYAEIVLATRAADLAHPAFNKLFLETEFLPAAEALLCRRRPRSVEQKPIWAVHVVAVDGPAVGDVEYETDRARFLGRGRTPAAPAALDSGAILSGTVGPVLDPVFSLRRRVRLQPAASVSVSFTTGVADTREQALALADQYHHHTAILRAFELAWAHSQVELTHLHLSPEDSHLYQRLASHVIYAGSAHRAPPSVLAANQQGLAGLWRLGISGDKPIVLVRISEMAEMALVQQLLTAHSYWRLKGLEVDLVILNEHPTGYFEELQEHLMNLCRSCDAHALIDKAGGVFLRKAAHLSEEDRVLLQAAARVVLVGSRGPLVSQVDHMERAAASPARLVITERRRDETEQTRRSLPHPAPNLLFHNGLGGFTPDGREYVLSVHAGAGEASSARGSPSPLHPSLPPVPWINVVANPNFGFLVSESGGGYTWGGNSQGNRLTPWTNDPVSDPPGEFLYLRDEATGEFWTCPFTAGRSAPEESGRRARDASSRPRAMQCTVRHGQGYTVIQQESYGLRQELLVFVPAADPVKIIRLKVENLGSSSRRLSATYYAEWVLGTIRDQTAMHVVTELDSETGALLARNVFRQDFAGGVAFADVALRPRTVTADRTEFLGRNGSPAAPAALERVELSGRVGAALDPCAALQAPFELKPGETKEIVFLLGEADGAKVARQLVQRYRQPAQVAAAFDAVKARWDGVLTAVQVRTTNPAMDLLLNRWLLYQVLSCRVWGRSAFYQSGGAFGFRDQLQDVMAVVYAAPEETRAQILRAAGRQFLEGDVQHWWHPPSGRGVRTRCSDDFLWLPYVTAHYVSATGDAAVWDESAPFLRAPVLKQDQEEEYGLPEISEQTGTIYDHCVRAIDHALRFGAHGLPLIGTGDWNDGMNRVGAGGKGESVWVGWFLLPILKRFAEIAAARGDAERAKAYQQERDRLRAAIEEQAWDGAWYRRAYFDDGAPLGSAQNDECKIDSLAQSWAVISGAGDRQRAREAMNAVNDWLVRRAEKLILLFAPPFDQGRLQPGYIKGYVPGIRENGGQYTHAAVWVVLAHALLGQGSRAMGLFDLLNPIHHAALPEDVARYRVEPYVVAADIYSEPPHTGRGGWTWYTGSAAWLYRVALEALLGFQLRGDRLMFDPRIPSHWGKYTITYRHRSATYHVSVENPHSVERGLESVTLDGVPCADNVIELADDGKAHQVRVIMG
ncbi:MAG TPA: glucoamylase family protein [Gemmataceae bacterium]|nr:glucoamylase family protein [Gemmataceae bacterium]